MQLNHYQKSAKSFAQYPFIGNNRGNLFADQPDFGVIGNPV